MSTETSAPKGRIAFLFLTRGDHNIPPLWEAYFQDAPVDQYSILVHPKERDALKSNLWRLPNVQILRPIPTQWATVSLVKATLYMLKVALRDKSNRKFVLVSESCIPATSFRTFYDTLMADGDRSCLSWRFNQNLDRLHIVSKCVTMGTANLRLPPQLWAKQSQWMYLDRRHAELFFLRDNIHEIVNVFRSCPAADEHFFINVLLYQYRVCIDELINQPITFVDWSVRSEHPRTFFEATRELISFVRSQKCMFARKFERVNMSKGMMDFILERDTLEVQQVRERMAEGAPVELKMETVIHPALVNTLRSCLYPATQDPEEARIQSEMTQKKMEVINAIFSLDFNAMTRETVDRLYNIFIASKRTNEVFDIPEDEEVRFGQETTAGELVEFKELVDLQRDTIIQPPPFRGILPTDESLELQHLMNQVNGSRDE